MPAPQFPPLLNGRSVAGALDPLAEACRLVVAGACGAADVLWSRNTEVADCAIVLEPDVALARCQQLVPMTMVAVAEALAVLCPPKVAVEFGWPGDILVNGATAGDVRLAAATCASEDVPQWLVIGMRLQLLHGDKDYEPGERLDVTCLAEEGAETISRSDVLASLASHWMARLNRWQDDGFRPLHDQWLYRARGRDAVVTFAQKGDQVTGKVLGLDENAGLMLKDGDQPLQILPMAPHLLHLNEGGQLDAGGEFP